jgi:L-histidine Nalpha-methyltransferase
MEVEETLVSGAMIAYSMARRTRRGRGLSTRLAPARCALSIETSLPLQTDRLSIVRLSDPSKSPSFAELVRDGLLSSPKSLPCQFFYDDSGSRLFERICELPEYYLTRTEDAILRTHAEAMVAGFDHAPVMIELGSGSSTKTRRLIEAALESYGNLHYIPIDVSPTILEESARELVSDYVSLRVTGYAGDYHVALAALAARIRKPKLLVFLGSSLGNYATTEAITLLRHVASSMRATDRLILGTDLAKDRSILEPAYDDAQGVTAEFNKNLLVRINRELGADFQLSSFHHEGRYRPELGRVEMHLVSREKQTVRISAAEITVPFAAGESIHTENSHKYTRSTLHELAHLAGFAEDAAWTDERTWFQVQRWTLDTGRGT